MPSKNKLGHLGIALPSDGQINVFLIFLFKAYSRKALKLKFVVLDIFRHSWPNRVQIYLRNTAGWVPDHHNKASITIES